MKKHPSNGTEDYKESIHHFQCISSAQIQWKGRILRRFNYKVPGVCRLLYNFIPIGMNCLLQESVEKYLADWYYGMRPIVALLRPNLKSL